jgi:regulator of cell morphogenesis and NO signaling
MTTSLLLDKTVREMALENAEATRIFERFGIDYCCGGGKSLEEACKAANIDVVTVQNALDEAQRQAESTGAHRDWQTEPLSDLIDYICTTHHKYTREECARLNALLDKVCSAHGERHPELHHIRAAFRGLAQELTVHMMKEEMVLFPYVKRMEESVMQHEPVLPAPFGTVQNPVRMMEQEHDSAGGALRAMRTASNGYQAPADACVSYRTLYHVLAVFEEDLHQHIHLENNILFPRALSMGRTN